MKLHALELASVLALSAVVAYSAGSVAARADGTAAGLAGDWQGAFTLDGAYPPRNDAVGRTVRARVHIDVGRPATAHAARDPRPAALDGDLRVFGMRGGSLRGARVQAARGDSVRIILGSGARTVVLVGRVGCGRVTGRWRHGSRAETETGRFELRRGPAGTGQGRSGSIHTTRGQG